MLLICGVAAFFAGIVLNAGTHLVIATNAPPTPLRRFLGGQASDALAVTLMFVGSMSGIIFLADYQTEAAVPLQLIVAVVIGAAAIFAIRRIRQRTAAAQAAAPEAAESPDATAGTGATGPVRTVGRHKHAA